MIGWNNTSLFSRIGNDTCRNLTRLVLWIFLSNLVVNLIWQITEYLIYGEIQPRLVDNIIAMVWIYFIVKTYYFGRDDGRDEWEDKSWQHVQDFVREIQRHGTTALRLFSDGDTIYFETMAKHEDGRTIVVHTVFDLEAAKRISTNLNAFILDQETKNKKGE